MIISLELCKDKAKLLMDHKIGIQKIIYCFIQKSFSFIDLNLDYIVMEMNSLSDPPKMILKGIKINKK